MSKIIVPGSMIFVKMTAGHNKLFAWCGWPVAADYNTGLKITEFEPGILLVAESVIKTRYHYWLYCLHPVIGPITLDQVNEEGFAKITSYYEITLCE
jgi:hypothetical protein